MYNAKSNKQIQRKVQMLILGRRLPNFKYQSSGTIMKNLIMSRFREKVKQ